mmetsp:Transcript_147838/g.474577  ORF Transcript_147838/g.474577 Transcript_147838/m.474577 type:complete len:334 (+) Transcript_147838:714-1715(+)
MTVMRPVIRCRLVLLFAAVASAVVQLLVPAGVPGVPPQDRGRLMCRAQQGHVSGGPVLIVAIHGVGPRQHQPVQGVNRSMGSGLVGGRVAAEALSVGIRARFHQQAHNRSVAPTTSPVQSRISLNIDHIHACPGLQQQARHIGASASSGDVQRCAAKLVNNVERSTSEAVELQEEDVRLGDGLEEAHGDLRIPPGGDAELLVDPIRISSAVRGLHPLTKDAAQLARGLPLGRARGSVVVVEVPIPHRLQSPALPRIRIDVLPRGVARTGQQRPICRALPEEHIEVPASVGPTPRRARRRHPPRGLPALVDPGGAARRAGRSLPAGHETGAAAG